VNASARAIRAPLRAARVAVAIVATAGLAGLVAACGGSPSSTGSRGSPSGGSSSSARSAEPFSVCMRSRGVPRYPDPSPGSPEFPAVVKSARAVGVSPSKLEAAERGCYHTLPIDATKLNRLSLAQCEYIGDCPRALVQQAMTQLENYARCMRDHGLPKWPDPVIGANGAPYFAISTSKDGFDPYSSQVQAKDRICTRVEHPAIGGAPIAVSP
jgi:hypothetical protein